MRKKLACFTIACAMIVTSAIPTFAEMPEKTYVSDEETDTSFNIDDYEQYTIDLTTMMPTTRAVSADTTTIASQYVRSLDLASRGFGYIEDACLAELEQYAQDGAQLDNYTVLVPKASATKKYYGSYGGHDFYYETTSMSSFTKPVSVNGAKKSKSTASKWSSWVKGSIDVVISLSNISKKFTIPYSVVSAVTGIFDANKISYGAYNEYIKTGGSASTNNPIKTRSIYRKSGSSYHLSYQDQTGPLKLTFVFHPADTALKTSYDIKDLYNVKSVCSTAFSKSSILQIANTQANHGSKVTYTLAGVNVKETW